MAALLSRATRRRINQWFASSPPPSVPSSFFCRALICNIILAMIISAILLIPTSTGAISHQKPASLPASSSPTRVAMPRCHTCPDKNRHRQTKRRHHTDTKSKRHRRTHIATEQARGQTHRHTTKQISKTTERKKSTQSRHTQTHTPRHTPTHRPAHTASPRGPTGAAGESCAEPFVQRHKRKGSVKFMQS